MSIIAYPLEATEYTAEDVQSYLSTRQSGVYSDEITFTPEGMTITVSPFLAWFNYEKFKGCSVAVTEPETLTFSPAHAVLDRIDRIVLRLDLSINKAYLTVIEGVASSSPVPPDIIKTEAVNDISPVYVKIKAGSAEITPADITSTILDESVCGIMRDGVTGIPTSQLQAQAEALIIRLHEAINDAEADTACMLRDLYDPEDKAKPVAFKDETPIYNQTVKDCNKALNTGWYICSYNCLNTPDNADIFKYYNKTFLEVMRRETALYQTIFSHGYVARRWATSVDDGATWTWEKWEWINPPLVSNVEYRTTERYNEKPVYIQDVPFGAMPDNASAAVTIAKKLEIISIEGYAVNGKYTIPLSVINNVNSIYYDKSNGMIHIETTRNASSNVATLIVKYTK
jgi:hypothetical protein